MGLLTEDQARLVPIVRVHRGGVDKFLGDGIPATFGGALAARALRRRRRIAGIEGVVDLIVLAERDAA